MEIRMLGPFEVLSDAGVAITPSAQKLRQVLQLLALHRGRVVRTDQITMELWDDRPPPSANTTMQTYIYQLRKLFSGAGEEEGTVTTTPAGYMLRLPSAAIDAERFEELVAEGRRLVAGGELGPGLERFDGALAMWRGSMLPTTDVGPVLQVEVVRLDELRKSVVEERIRVALMLGQHRQLVGELTGLVVGDPTHEGLQAKLMLALYRCGRRAEALAAYRGAQRVLDDELGLEPGPELRQLHRRMLAADPALDQPGPAGHPALMSTEPPSQLPPDTMLVGRDRELETIRRALAAGGRAPVVAVDGPPGVGKSALCVHGARRVRGEFRDGQLWAELTTAEGEPVAPGDVLADFLRASGFPEARIPDETVERARMFRSWTADRKVLVVLDDVASAEQLTPLLPSGSGCATVLTSRCRLVHPAITRTVPLGPLDRRTAGGLLTELLGADRFDQEPGSLGQVLDRCAGLPTAVRGVVGRLGLRPHWPVARILGAIGAADLVGPLRRSYHLLTMPTRVAFLTIAAGDGRPLTVRAAEDVLDLPAEAAEAVLEELVEFQLAEVEPVGAAGEFRYRVPPLYRAAAAALDEVPEVPRPRSGCVPETASS